MKKITCIERLPRSDGCLLASTLQLLLALKVALDFNRWEVSHVLHALVLSETLRSSSCGEARRSLGFLQVNFHALCPLDIY